jgi:NADH-quinone oxidoreductase subunit J
MAVLAVICAVGMVSARNPVHSALWLVGNFIALAVIFLILSAPLLFAIQLIVYAGAIMVLFLFVIMFFMSPQALRWLRPTLKGQLVFGGMLVIAFLLLMLWGLGAVDVGALIGGVPSEAGLAQEAAVAASAAAPTMGYPAALGNWLFRYHALPFELTSVLLLIAMIGALMVARDIRSEGRRAMPETAPVAHTPEAGSEEAGS